MDPRHPIVRRFKQMKLLKRTVRTDKRGNIVVEELRRDPKTGSKQRLRYST